MFIKIQEKKFADKLKKTKGKNVTNSIDASEVCGKKARAISSSFLLFRLLGVKNNRKYF